MWFGKDKSILGVDIGTQAIKLVQLNTENYMLETYGIVDLPEPITSQTGDAVVNEVATLLQNLCLKAKVTTKRCAMSLPNQTVFTSVIDMPKMREEELEQAISFEAKKYVPMPIAEVSLSWSVISENPADNSTKVLLIAVPKQIRDMFINIFHKAGLELEVIEIEALALIRSLIDEQSKNDVIIDVGAKVTGINFVKDGLLQLTRNLNIGGDTITEKIGQTLNLQLPRAEQFKRDFGLNSTDFLPEAVKPVLNNIKTEVKQILDLYKSHGAEANRILLVGGGAQMPGMKEYFSDLGITVVPGESLQKISYPQEVESVLKRFSMQLPVAIGLAMRNQN